MYFGPKKVKQPDFDRDAFYQEVREFMISRYPQWTIFEGTQYCDFLVIKNVVKEIDTEINPEGPNPFTKHEQFLCQVAIAIDITPSKDITEEEQAFHQERAKILENFTKGHLITSSLKSVSKFLDKF